MHACADDSMCRASAPGCPLPCHHVKNKLEGASAYCCRIVSDVILALHPNPDLHRVGMGYNLESTELLSKQQLHNRMAAFVGDAGHLSKLLP